MPRRLFGGRPTPAEAIAGAAEAAKGLDAAAQRELVSAAATAALVPSQTTINDIWRYLVVGLVGVLFIALVGLVVLFAVGKTPDSVLTAFSATLTGLLGLFAPSPVRNGGGGGQPGAGQPGV
jgi:hypothetical protein